MLYVTYALGAPCAPPGVPRTTLDEPRAPLDAPRAPLGALRATLCAVCRTRQQLSPGPIRICQCKTEIYTEGDRFVWSADNSQSKANWNIWQTKGTLLYAPRPPPKTPFFGLVKP